MSNEAKKEPIFDPELGIYKPKERAKIRGRNVQVKLPKAQMEIIQPHLDRTGMSLTDWVAKMVRKELRILEQEEIEYQRWCKKRDEKLKQREKAMAEIFNG